MLWQVKRETKSEKENRKSFMMGLSKMDNINMNSFDYCLSFVQNVCLYKFHSGTFETKINGEMKENACKRLNDTQKLPTWRVLFFLFNSIRNTSFIFIYTYMSTYTDFFYMWLLGGIFKTKTIFSFFHSFAFTAWAQL